MATVAVQQSTASLALGLLIKPFIAIGNFLIVLGENSSRMQKVKTLNEMTDEQLAAKGLTREDIVRHVFADSMYV
jgi:uncharacterized protein YjiS (DUF1127 family)